jgi:hypothetical protein
MAVSIDLWTTVHDDHYRVADWFRGGEATLEVARAAPSPHEADLILQGAYRGRDQDGVGVVWAIAQEYRS